MCSIERLGKNVLGVLESPEKVLEVFLGKRVGTLLLSLPLFCCLVFLSTQDYMMHSQAVFVKPCRIMNYCYGKN